MTLAIVALAALVAVAVVVLAVVAMTMSRGMKRLEQQVTPPPVIHADGSLPTWPTQPGAFAQPAPVGPVAPMAVAPQGANVAVGGHRVHEPQATTAADVDPRFPWKAKGTRKPLIFWDRIKFLLLFGLAFGLLTWNEYLRIRPVGALPEAASNELRNETWLVVLLGIELVRQLHFVVAERVRWYHRFWSEKVFGRTNAWWERRFNPWNRYRIARVGKILLVVALAAVVVGKVTKSPPVVALFQAPVLLVQALPYVMQLAFAFFFVIFQFVGLFWFLSKGGIDTYFPEDIETRFSDVWGQDHVLERVKENIVLLENPDEIESKGGTVPSGILLWGPPGTGKTLMAEAVAGETGKPYVFVDPGAFNAMFMGIGVLKVKSLFRKLRKLALRYGGVIVFFDEADVLGSRTLPSSQPGFMSPSFEAMGCNGFAHLSHPGRSLVAGAGRAAADVEVPAGHRVNRFVAGMGMGGAGSGTLQALLTELSGLKKPRGFINRVVRRALGMRPKPPPKYRILIMMATNLVDALDPALLRPGRIDRKYKVGYPSKAGRVRTYEGYLNKVTHNLTLEQIDRLATITPYATGAEIKDTVNEALIYAIGDGREVITWEDVIKAKQRKQLGPPEDVEYIERERHAVAVHEACHAVLAWKTRDHYEIDLATIEKGADYLGMVASVKTEDQFTRWRTEHESDILVSLASLAGERLFFDGDNSSGVSGDLQSATYLAALMESHWGMGSSISSLPALQALEIGMGGPEQRGGGPGAKGGIGFGAELGAKKDDPVSERLGQRIEANLSRLFQEAELVLREHRAQVLALAHALETHKTLTGDDVVAILEYRRGPLVDGSPYADPAFAAELEAYHAAAVAAHRNHAPVDTPLPQPAGSVVQGMVLAAAVPAPEPWTRPVPDAPPVPVAPAPTNGNAPLSWGLRPQPPAEQNGAAEPEPEDDEKR